MISIPLSYLSEKISEVLSQSAHRTNVIRLSLKAQFKAQIRCPYCGGKIRKFGFYPKQIFDAVTGTLEHFSYSAVNVKTNPAHIQ